MEEIRNFAIIAHIDHGKSTLADRILEVTGAVSPRLMREQFLDSLELERERGITIKLKAIRLNYQLSTFPAVARSRLGGDNYQLNLIDTPGHVDFGYEVSRSLAACEGAVLVVDASQGIEAQTVANFHKARENNLKIIPFINKIDLAVARPERVVRELREAFGFIREEIILGSAKTGQGVDQLLAAVVARIPAPQGQSEAPLRALIFDSTFDEYKGVVAFIKVVDGRINLGRGPEISFLGSKARAKPLEVGFLNPNLNKVSELKTGEVGYVATGLKEISQVRVGDTVTEVKSDKLKVKSSEEKVQALPGYQEPKPMVFLGLYPAETDDFVKLRKSLEKLKLSDASVKVEAESSEALGLGFRCGFLGLLHAEIVQERLERDYGLNLIATRPSVVYQVELTGGEVKEVNRASALPEASKIKAIREPILELKVFAPQEYTGAVMSLSQDYRAEFKDLAYLGNIAQLTFEAPLSEIVTDFYDRLKSVSSGFASLDYELLAFRPSALCRLDVLVSGRLVDPLSQIVPREKAVDLGRRILLKLKETIHRHQFLVILQAAVGGKILAREEIPALRKNVLAKMSGGHRERKDKLLDRQREGKKRLKSVGAVEIPQEAFRVILSKR